MVFRIRIASKSSFPYFPDDSDDDSSIKERLMNCLEVEGCNLAELTTRLRSHSFLEKRREVLLSKGMYAVEITAVNHQDEPAIDWNSREPHEFCKALAALGDELQIYNFVCFPLPLLKILLNEKVERVFLYDSVLDSMASPRDVIESSTVPALPSRDRATHEMAFSVPLVLHVSNVLRASDWTAYASYLQNICVDHPESCLHTVQLYLEVSDVDVDLQQEEYQLFFKAISSLRTRSLDIIPRKFPEASVFSNLVFTPNLAFPGLEFCDLDWTLNARRVHFLIRDPDWLVLATWLLKIRLLGRVSFQECVLLFQPLNEEEVNPEHYLTFLEILCALQIERVEINTCWASLELVPILLKSFQPSGKELPKLNIIAEDCDWMIHDKVLEALKGKTRFLEITIELLDVETETLKKMEDVLRVNHTITMFDFQGALTPTLEMYEKLNRDGRCLLASKGAHDLTPEEWIGILLSTIECVCSANDEKLTCLFYFVRKYSSYYVSLFGRAKMDDCYMLVL